MLHAESIEVTDIAFDLMRQQVTVGSITLEGILSHQWLDETGRMRYENLIPNVQLLKISGQRTHAAAALSSALNPSDWVT
jgi:hypothetical protein